MSVRWGMLGGTGGDVAMVEETAHGLLEAHIYEFGCLGEMSHDSNPLDPKDRRRRRFGAAAEGVEDDVALVG